jgi:hypothetical protein
LNLVVDANIFKSYFMESVLEKNTNLTDSTIKIFEMGNLKNLIFHDDGGIIQKEWENLVEPEWFQTWLGDMFSSGKLIEITPINDDSLKSKLKNNGFPINTKDYKYVTTANSVAKKNNYAYIVTEDMDFYSPKEKNCDCKRRGKIISASSSEVGKTLKRFNISAVCVKNIINLL